MWAQRGRSKVSGSRRTVADHLSNDGRGVAESRGHWEGDTLVVETRNFRNGPSAGGASKDAILVERFRRVSPEILEYEYTMNDPATWTAPWTAVQTLRKNPDAIFEYACHEGNYGLTNMLRGARLEEAAGGGAQP